MKKYKVTFYVEYWNKEVRIFEIVIFAADLEEAKCNGLKIFVNDTIESGTDVLDNATIIQVDTSSELEEIEQEGGAQ